MFNCDLCNKTSKSGEKPFVKVVETRIKTYNYGRYNKRKTTNGHEIVREEKLCNMCKILSDKETIIPNQLNEQLVYSGGIR